MSDAPSIGWSDFARGRYRPGSLHSHYLGSEEELIALAAAHWDARRPGTGRDGLDEVVVVPVPAEGFVGATVRVDETSRLSATLTRRAPDEDAYVEVWADGPREPVRHAAVVLYAANILLENGGIRSTDRDWEIVCVIASPVPDEPLDPLTMARNMLAKPGGTPCTYSAEAFAEAIWYWSGRARIADPE